MPKANVLAPCGIDCSNCEIYQAANDPELAEQVAARWRETWLPDAQADWLKCQGCRGDRSLCWTGDCKLYECGVRTKGLDYCSDCTEFPCKQLEEWGSADPKHRQALDRLHGMRGAK